MSPRTTISRLRRPLVAAAVAAGISAGVAAPALAQDSLPDPDQSKTTKAADKPARSSDLPKTGVDATWLVLAGVALLGTGVAVRPAARLRRAYRTDAWEQAVRSGL